MIEHLTGNDDLIRAGLFDERAQAALDRILPADGRSPQHLVQHRLRSQTQPVIITLHRRLSPLAESTSTRHQRLLTLRPQEPHLPPPISAEHIITPPHAMLISILLLPVSPTTH